MSNLQEALQNSGIIQDMQEKEREQKLQPVVAEEPVRRRWWQNFRLSLTKYEIPVLLVVRCEKWEEGLKFISEHHLNHTRTRCKDEVEARDDLRRAIVDWYAKDTPKPVEPEVPSDGSLLYWRIYGA